MLGLTTFSPYHFPSLMGCKPAARLSSFIGFQWVGLGGPPGNFRNFLQILTEIIITDQIIRKISILFLLLFSKYVIIFIYNSNNYRYRLKRSIQTENSRKSRKFRYCFYPYRPLEKRRGTRKTRQTQGPLHKKRFPPPSSASASAAMDKLPAASSAMQWSIDLDRALRSRHPGE